MFPIDTSTAAAALPVPSAAGTEGYFTSGDPEKGVPPTTISADWLNMVQEELRAVATSGGAEVDKGNNGQVLTAINALIAEAVASLPAYTFTTDASGNWKRTFPDGVIEIGTVLPAVSSESQYSTVFPFGGFPNQYLGMSWMTINPNGSATGDTTLQEVSSSKTGMTVMVQSDGTFGDGSGGFRCILKGR